MTSESPAQDRVGNVCHSRAALLTLNDQLVITGLNSFAVELLKIPETAIGANLALLHPRLQQHISELIPERRSFPRQEMTSIRSSFHLGNTQLRIWLYGFRQDSGSEELCLILEPAASETAWYGDIEAKILSTAPILAVALDGTGSIVFVTPSVENVLGYDASEVLGDRWWTTISIDGLPRNDARDEYAKYARGDVALDGGVREIEYRHRDGSPRWVLWSFAKGAGDLLVGVGQDVTARKIEKLQLQHRTTQLDALIASSPLGIVIADNDGNVTSVNLANLNTVGYKQTRTTFRDLFYQNVGSSGSGNPIQIGAGAGVGAVSTIFSGSNIESSGVPTDVAISGEGFFVVERDGVSRYTRAGNFTVGPTGILSTQNGEQVLGYTSNNGTIDPSQGLVPLQMGKGQISPPNATSSVLMRTNLDATEAVGYAFNSPMTVYDSLGASHVVSFEFTKTAANNWQYSVTLPGADTGGATDTILSSGSLSFDDSGKLSTPASDVLGIATPPLANGAGPITFDWDIYDDGAGMLTQLAAPSATASKNQDGFGSGSLEDFTIGSDGIIQGSFTNGKTMAIGQLVLANFPNTQGLLRAGQNDFEATLASGLPAVGAPGTGGRGGIAGGALELSNVDISTEFAKMIVAQRAFQANARAVTTFDEITQETINLKR